MSKLLLIDDEREFVEMLSVVLKRAGNQMLEAFNGEDGIKIAKKEKPDVILLDINMPKMDGHEVALRLKNDEETKMIPIIIVTAKKDSETISRSFDLEVADYITKPFENSVLLEKIKKALSPRR
ncbi:hypothetical protein A2276_04765 [candidate division WOR-1 bacterium RIFOXYA12_FULL_43_27]|uniref:Response regulatory domain-containing protein n=1 Tax=candidate division WOR-1 bacterium RIFOXYC2_FULL_46_14 TaxID=1802587 RepID=A0A1F4U2S7_UNCSA|nr:MAG: hypothetical protein A2276_04765 [candidate division WOR-1 bacterium RIFOXYA12_FULL_43_27]OGC18864.1 MAG: hypothetical protein A2292_08070 [candidate division WOR-1 bacterium RIFOXYB2_FULL_46_45]OGC29005.1 MAG: hypothetical protein A2232_03135 [candidate division WOR-1 bacterium RIFOXYA2_FULL_46_56]OGC39264.1 MAG: hypothetical protein A2438_07035 [candidate division WOR-1 bacterium RIFOXYC2_FULL_46_14]